MDSWGIPPRGQVWMRAGVKKGTKALCNHLSSKKATNSKTLERRNQFPLSPVLQLLLPIQWISIHINFLGCAGCCELQLQDEWARTQLVPWVSNAGFAIYTLPLILSFLIWEMGVTICCKDFFFFQWYKGKNSAYKKPTFLLAFSNHGETQMVS